ncbi:MAG TPA: hypothetical protein VHM90_16265 [Phycisphaerae bacterium]|jgi:hypothetical protein|nr:hypothetical protein [Phycisphaerae bacterium]
MTTRFKFTLLALAAFALGACNGVSTVHLQTNGAAEVSVDGQNLGPAPVTFGIPWRNIHNTINFSKRVVKVTANGKVVYNKDISDEVYAKQQTGDFKDGSQFGTGRTYTLNVDVSAGK